jgi:methylated-DNA-[protein]-cysteine S-methyltransferase
MHATILDTAIGRLELIAGAGALREIRLLGGDGDDGGAAPRGPEHSTASGGAPRGSEPATSPGGSSRATPDAAAEAAADRAVLNEARRQLSEYFAGARRTFDLPLAPEGTAFQRRVWEHLRAIGYGETVSYGVLAAALDAPRAARAVGAALGRNPLPLVVPCHRVIGAAGDLRGFGLGIDVKRRLLELEAGV